MKLRALPVFLLPMLLSLTGCGDRASPILEELAITANPNPSAPLAASALIRTDEPVTLTFRIEGDGARWDVDPEVDLAAEHRVPLLGLQADTDHRIVVVATDAAGNTATFDAIELQTDPLPEDFGRTGQDWTPYRPRTSCRINTSPGKAPVSRPASTTACPFTKTYSMPSFAPPGFKIVA